MLKPIEETVFILSQLNYKIQHSLEVVIEKSTEHNIDDDSTEVLFYFVMDLGLILSVSYLDELNKYFFKALRSEKGEHYSKGLMKVLKIPKNEIEKKFPDLKNFRNNYLAHNMRIDKQNYESVVLNGGLRKYRIPQNTHDYIFLTSCIKSIDVVINYIFPDAYKISELYRINSVKTSPLLTPQFQNIESIELELSKLKGLISKGIQELELI